MGGACSNAKAAAPAGADVQLEGAPTRVTGIELESGDEKTTAMQSPRDFAAQEAHVKELTALQKRIMQNAAALDQAMSTLTAQHQAAESKADARMRKLEQMIERLVVSVAPKAAGYTCEQVRAAGVPCGQAKASGYTLREQHRAGYTISEARAAFSLQEMLETGYTLADAKAAGFSESELSGAGFTTSQRM